MKRKTWSSAQSAEKKTKTMNLMKTSTFLFCICPALFFNQEGILSEKQLVLGTPPLCAPNTMQTTKEGGKGPVLYPQEFNVCPLGRIICRENLDIHWWL